MKQKIVNFITLSFVTFGMVSCGTKNTGSAHNFTEDYLFDNEKHWRECTDKGCIQQIDVAIHEYLEWTTVEEPTCNKVGKEMSKCIKCNYVLEREIPMKDHAVGDTWSSDDNNHWHTCDNDANEKVDFNAHSLVWIYSTEPTCTVAGRGYQKCTVCGYRFAETDIPAYGHDWKLDEDITTYATCETAGVVKHVCNRCGAEDTKTVAAGHNWSQPTYQWSDNLGSVTATRICGNNPEHVETETVLTDVTHLSPTCDAVGNYTYTTRAFANAAFKQQTKVITLEKCSETLQHHCEAEKYTAGEIYDECTVCHKKYNSRTCEQPWVDYYFPTEMTNIITNDNGAGSISSFDAEAKTLTLVSHKGKSGYITFDAGAAVTSSIGKRYFVMTYTLLEDSGGWWDTYLTVSGKGNPSKIRFGKINADAVVNYDMNLATFIVNGEVVGWNGVKSVGETGTIYLDISALKSGVNQITLSSDGGVKLRIDYAGFKSSMCDHDLSCYQVQTGSTCAGLITTTYNECQECHYITDSKSSGIPTGYKALDLSKPKNIRWSPSCYDYGKHVITIPNTVMPGPFFEVPACNKMIVQFSLDYDASLVDTPDASKANFELRFFNEEGKMYVEQYKFICATSGLTGTSAGIDNPTPYKNIARLVSNETGETISNFALKQVVVLEINVSDRSIKDFAQFILSGSQGSIVTVENLIYC